MRVTVFLVVALVAFSCVASANELTKKRVDQCLDVKNDKQCLDSFDEVSGCLWCVSKAVPSNCVNAEQAARLPEGVFDCKNSSSVRPQPPQPRPAPPTPTPPQPRPSPQPSKTKVEACLDVKNDKKCLDSYDEVSGCLWCVSKAVPSNCVNAEQAARLPEGVFDCKNSSRVTFPAPSPVEAPRPRPTPRPAPQPTKTKVEACLDVKNDKKCLDSYDEVSGCLWCVSKAVPSNCVNAEQAARLPEGVFDCKNSSRVAAEPIFEASPALPTYVPRRGTKGSASTTVSAVPCYDIRSQRECKRSTDSVGKCQWCKAMAVPSICVDPQQASRLPSGVFICS